MVHPEEGPDAQTVEAPERVVKIINDEPQLADFPELSAHSPSWHRSLAGLARKIAAHRSRQRALICLQALDALADRLNPSKSGQAELAASEPNRLCGKENRANRANPGES
jgi:hypothetical protein